MNKFAKTIAALLFLMGTANNGLSDEIRLIDNSVIYGTVTSFQNGTYQIETAFAGTLQISADNVKKLSTDDAINVTCESGNTLVGKFDVVTGQTAVSTVNGIVDVSDDNVLAVWRTGAVSPLAPPPPTPRKWKYELIMDVGGKTGNSEKISTAGGLNAVLASPEDRLKAYLRADRSKENGTKTASEAIGGLDYESFFKGRSSWYARTEMEVDDVELLDLRATAALGYGYYFLKKDEHTARARIGFQLIHEAFQNGNNTTDPGIDLGLHHFYKLKKWGKLTTDITYTPSFNDFNDYRVYP